MSVLRIARAPLRCCALLLMVVSVGPARAADAPHPLDMATVLSQVAAHSPMLAASGAMSVAARERIAPAGAWSAPMLEAGVVNVPTTGRFDADMMTMKMVGVEQKVPISGANALARRAATHAYEAARWNTQRDRVNVFGDAWKAYADAYLAGLAADAADAHDQVMARMEDAARAKVASGRGRIGEVLTAQAERARLSADGERARAEQRAALAKLAALRGRDTILAGETLAAPPEWLAPDSTRAWDAAYGVAHPALRAMAASVAGNRASADAMRRMRWPELDVKASYGMRQTLQDGMKQDNMFSTSVGVMLPVGYGGREGAQARAMDAMASAGESERRALALDLRQQLDAARNDARVNERRVRVLRDTVLVLQQRALDADWGAYASGSLDLARVLDTAHAAYTTQIEIIRARQDLAAALARVLTLSADGSLVGVTLPTEATRSSR
jgi:outer membrane protein TolC